MATQLSIYGQVNQIGKPKIIQDCLVVVTGATRGIGLACKEAFKNAGAQVVGCDLSGSDFELDVTSRNDWAKLIKKYDVIDVLINNAGIMPIGPFLEMSDEAIENQIDINLKGVIYGMRAVLPGMIRQDYGHVVNSASMLGVIPIAGGAVYSATKGGVILLSESMRVELRHTGVKVSHVLPSIVNTQMIAGAKPLSWPKPISPEMVGKAIVQAVKTGQIDIWVPWIMKWVIGFGKLLPRSWGEALALSFGMGEMFIDINPRERAGYRIAIGGE